MPYLFYDEMVKLHFKIYTEYHLRKLIDELTLGDGNLKKGYINAKVLKRFLFEEEQDENN